MGRQVGQVVASANPQLQQVMPSLAKSVLNGAQPIDRFLGVVLAGTDYRPQVRQLVVKECPPHRIIHRRCVSLLPHINWFPYARLCARRMIVVKERLSPRPGVIRLSAQLSEPGFTGFWDSDDFQSYKSQNQRNHSSDGQSKDPAQTPTSSTVSHRYDTLFPNKCSTYRQARTRAK